VCHVEPTRAAIPNGGPFYWRQLSPLRYHAAAAEGLLRHNNPSVSLAAWSHRVPAAFFTAMPFQRRRAIPLTSCAGEPIDPRMKPATPSTVPGVVLLG
jgi:hypothetical protein